jgi:hypothetical protein
MQPIVIDGKKHISLSEFEESFAELCQQHRAEERAIAFAFLLYDFRDQQIRKILADQDYWESLHAISGKYLTIFYIDTKQKTPRRKRPKMDSGNLYNMYTLILNGAEPLEPVNTFLRDQFGISEYAKQPLIIFFNTDGKDFSANFAVELKKEIVDEAFVELKKAIAKAVEATERIHPNNYGNTGEILQQIKQNVEGDPVLRIIQTYGRAATVAVLSFAVQQFVQKTILE